MTDKTADKMAGRRTGIFGGTFDPVHIGHIRAAQAAADALALHRVLLIPTYIPPHKTAPENSAAPAHRLAMLQLAVREDDRLVADDRELRRGGKSYTADTVQALHAEEPEAALFLICGTDMFLTVQNWMRAEVLFAETVIVAAARLPDEESALNRHAAYLRDTYGARVVVLDNTVTVCASTELRAGIAQGEADGLADGLAPAVAAYIAQHGLYAGKTAV